MHDVFLLSNIHEKLQALLPSQMHVFLHIISKKKKKKRKKINISLRPRLSGAADYHNLALIIVESTDTENVEEIPRALPTSTPGKLVRKYFKL